MSNFIQHQAILENDGVNKLSLQAELFLHRLLNAVDRYGCFDARIPMLRARLFPLKLDDVTPDAINGWLTECVNAGLVKLYQVNGMAYLYIVGFKRSMGPRKTTVPAPLDDTPGGTTPTPKGTTTVAVTDKDAMHEHFLKELYKRENTQYLNRLVSHIRQPELKPAWVHAFNAHLKQTGKKYTIDYEWLNGLRKWLPLNIHRLRRQELNVKAEPAISIVFDPAVV